MILQDDVVTWARCDVMRVGYLAHRASTHLDIEGRVVVVAPGAAGFSVDAAARGRRYSGNLDESCVAVLPPCSRMELRNLGPGIAVVIALDPDYIARSMVDASRALCGQARSADPYLVGIARDLRAMFRERRAPPPAVLERMAEEVREHLSRFYTRRRRKQAVPALRPDRLERATRYMREHYQHKELSVTEVAGSVGLSAFHFTRMFTKATGQAPHAYLTSVRLEQARHLLGATCLPIAEIANRCGYATHAHFTGVFGRHAGMTPAAYRAHVRAERTAARAQSAA